MDTWIASKMMGLGKGEFVFAFWCFFIQFFDSFKSSKNLGKFDSQLTWFPTCCVFFPFDTQFNLSIVFLKMNSGKTGQHRCKVLPSVDMNLRVLPWPRNTIITSMLLGKVWGWWSKWATTSAIFLASANLDTIEGDMVDFLLVKHDDLGYVFWLFFHGMYHGILTIIHHHLGEEALHKQIQVMIHQQSTFLGLIFSPLNKVDPYQLVYITPLIGVK